MLNEIKNSSSKLDRPDDSKWNETIAKISEK